MDKYQHLYIYPAESIVIQTLFGLVQAHGSVVVSMSTFETTGGRLSQVSREMLDKLSKDYGLSYEEDPIEKKVRIWHHAKTLSKTT